MSSDRSAGLLFGLALADALGAPVEFLSLREIKATYGAAGIQEPPAPALYTDDTQMALALCEGILDAGLEAATEAQMQRIGSQFVEWRHSPENNRAPGATCMNGIGRYETGIPWHKSGILNSKGSGTAMRVAPLGYLYQHDEARLRELASASSLITHRHPTAIAASVAAAYAVKLALDNVPVSQFIPRIMAFIDGMSDEMDDALRRVGHVGAWADEEKALAHVGEGWTGEEAVALALYCVLRYPDNYVRCVRRAANTNGDSDTIACIAGGIMGARLGLDSIPLEWQNRCENRQYLLDLAQRMAFITSNAASRATR